MNTLPANNRQIVAKPPQSVVTGKLEWQRILAAAWRDPVAFCRHLKLPESVAAAAENHGASFKFFCPAPFADRIQSGNPRDPLLLQVLPTELEADEHQPQAETDPLREQEYLLAPGLLKKYQGRALLVASGVCAINCRYCFRRNFPYHTTPRSLDQWQPALEQLANDPGIEEVIVSGGDPLAMRDELLLPLLNQLDQMEHVQRIRIHSRLPIMIPQRITAELTDGLRNLRSRPILVLHCNHAQELDAEVAAAIERLGNARCLLLNQSVLLSGINDDLPTLIELSQRLVEFGVLPYYLHQLDPVRGGAHFGVPPERGRELVQQMRAQISGFLVPRFVVELPGEPHKTILA